MIRAFLYVLVTGIFLFMLALPFNAAAEDEDQNAETPAVSSEVAAEENNGNEEGSSDVTVTATRSEAEINKVSSDSTVITKEDIEDSTSRTVPDVLEDTHGIMVRDLFGLGTSSTVDMRGFARGLNTAVLIDGMKVNRIDLLGVDWNLIPLENVERIEIIRGSASVLYGDNATSGAINIITKKKKKPGAHLTAEGSYKNERSMLDIGGSNGKSSITFVFLKRKEEGYRDNSAFDSQDLSVALEHGLTDRLYLNLSGAYHMDTQEFPGYLGEAEMKADRTKTNSPLDGAKNTHGSTGAELGYILTPEAELTLSYGSYDRSTDSTMNGPWGSSNMAADKLAEDTKLKITLDSARILERNVLTAGIDSQNAGADSIFDMDLPAWFTTSTTTQKVSKDELGFYAYDTLYVTKSLSFDAGYRVNKAEFKYKSRYTDNWGSDTTTLRKSTYRHEAAKAGITLNHTDGGKIFLGYSTGFRFPTMDEQLYADGKELREEKTTTLEAGISHPVTEDILIGATLYAMRVEDELYYNPFARYDPVWMMYIGANQNLDKTVHKGAEAYVTARMGKRLRINLNWTYMDATFESGQYKGSDVPLVARNSGNASVTVKATDALKVSAAANYVGKRPFDSDNDNSSKKLESYTTVDLKLDYTLGNIEFYAGADNVLSDEHSEYGVKGSAGQLVYYPSPEITVYGGAKIRF